MPYKFKLKLLLRPSCGGGGSFGSLGRGFEGFTFFSHHFQVLIQPFDYFAGCQQLLRSPSIGLSLTQVSLCGSKFLHKGCFLVPESLSFDFGETVLLCCEFELALEAGDGLFGFLQERGG